MKATIDKVEFVKEWHSQYGTMYSFKVQYNGKTAFYNAKKRDQTYFVKGQEANFVEQPMKSAKGEYIKIKPERPGGFQNSTYGKKLKQEQSKYSGFAVSYAKDLVVADKLPISDLPDYATILFELMVSLDKSIE